LLQFVAHLIRATHPGGPETTPDTERFVRHGVSPRGGQSMVLAAKVWALSEGRFAVSREDLKRVAEPALRHRAILNFEAEAENVRVESLLPGWLKAADHAVP
jgi:MoxR-like ATPase